MKTFVLFGSTGDLATRYVLPALGTLLQKGAYDHLICVGRRDWTRDDFRAFLAPYPDLLNHTETISYVRLDIEGGDYSGLKTQLETIHTGEGEVTYHLCLSPEYFVTVAKGLASVGLNLPNTRVMIEKPFGHDLTTAIHLNLELQKYFRENQIYRVDHYLGKNFVRELRDFRLEQKGDWYSDRIAEIHIVARETLTIEDRGAFYDKNGVTRDFLQNHLLQILALCTMRMPLARHDNCEIGLGNPSLEEDEIRDRIFMAISSVAPLLLDPRHDIILGQYEGYQGAPGVAPNSRTPTYIFTNLVIDNSRWLGVKVTLETGKALDRKESSVRFVFRDGTDRIFAETSSNKNNAYETLIEKALIRDASYFVRWDSVRAAWQVVDELLHCTDNCPLLQIYKPGAIMID
ncbi:hypothetical protein KA050_03670 [Candidatus Gracilibacteria bacterium]|nr:hypothetical protein [Candidatus Gracilibacteria bacterium]